MYRLCGFALLLGSLAAALLLAGCLKTGVTTTPTTPTPLRVFAASSLTDVCDSLSPSFERSHQARIVQATYAGTQELRVQLEQGAKCDVFISGSKKDVDALLRQQLLSGVSPLATNGLCLLVWPGREDIKSVQDLTKSPAKVVVAVPTCPLGLYTRRCWEKMSRSKEFGREFMIALNQRVVSEETNARQVVARVELGEADAAFAYLTDGIGRKVRTVRLTDEVQVPVTYYIGLGANAGPAAADYVALLLGPEGAEALKRYGFGLPPAAGKSP